MKYSKVKSIRTLEPFVIQRSTLPFRGQEPNFQAQLQNFNVLPVIKALEYKVGPNGLLFT